MLFIISIELDSATCTICEFGYSSGDTMIEVESHSSPGHSLVSVDGPCIELAATVILDCLERLTCDCLVDTTEDSVVRNSFSD